MDERVLTVNGYSPLYDRQLNNWLHDYVYKRSYPGEVGCHLRSRYEQGGIKNEKGFREGMCYPAAKDTEKHGCCALKTTHEKRLAERKRSLNQEVGAKVIQPVTISRPTAYGEYAPYTNAALLPPPLPEPTVPAVGEVTLSFWVIPPS